MRTIPKIIHQSWKDNNIPYSIYPQVWIDSWTVLHPQWERKFWTDEDNEILVRDHYPQYYTFYRDLRPNIKKAGFARYLYMHKYGGMYVDLDFICLKDMSDLLHGYEIVLGHLSQDNDYYQIPDAFMASCRGHEFWLRTATDAQHAPPHEQSVEKHTGPFRLQWAYYKYQPQNSIVYEHELIYPLDWIHLTDWENGRYFRDDQARLAHQIRSLGVDAIAQLLPRSYCVTLWTHNWGE